MAVQKISLDPAKRELGEQPIIVSIQPNSNTTLYDPTFFGVTNRMNRINASHLCFHISFFPILLLTSPVRFYFFTLKLKIA